MVQTLASGKSIELRGIGSFTVKQVAARKVSFANTPKDVVPAHGRIVFRPYKALKESVWGHKA
jgi:nucleoid DNA-binding protein